MRVVPLFRTFRLCALWFAVGASTTADVAAQVPPSFTARSSDLVVLSVNVFDRDHQLIPDLSEGQFLVYDNGRRQPIEVFSGEGTPVSVALVIDNSSSMRKKAGEVVAATLAFARASDPDDELFILEFNDRVRDALEGRRVTADDHAELLAALQSLKPQGQTALYDALIAGLDHLERATRLRRVLVLMSDGGDNASAARLDDVLARARKSNVTIYTIGLFDDGSPETNPGILRKLAQTTGGERHLPRSPGLLLQVCRHIASEIRSGYTIGFVPPDRDGKFHDVRVTVALPERRPAQVRTRPGYFAAEADRP
jgi:VWFA-related protein